MDAVFCAYQMLMSVIILINNYCYIKLPTFRLFFESFSTKIIKYGFQR